MNRNEFVTEELTDLYYETENALKLFRQLSKMKQSQLVRVKDNLIKKQAILARAIHLIQSNAA